MTNSKDGNWSGLSSDWASISNKSDHVGKPQIIPEANNNHDNASDIKTFQVRIILPQVLDQLTGSLMMMPPHLHFESMLYKKSVQ